ncbi:hypothetical protein [Paenibacillus macquariensis]|uniref:Peptidylprolyl isomerase n=1 Tax=Paenibacillus macquariensis TaxID=948756 RepID=A0ABY1K783_9BACL|nr:hypothetical protein [Paenibacillus macquariensis]MEC0092492.1 peptidylprolyl isomerase [Paenibacillus macquariensis]OAB35451.1 hypothetical protein PMSM_09345 [Paenibacillus macquariensis subsp. macquariensis]SIR35477.1 hypothetical protein SAMN05421578_111174 [Paenibacillus macquariensis]
MTEEERLGKLREQLEELNKAIIAIQNGAQEYRIGSRSLKRPDLSLLYKERDRLEREILNVERGGSIFHQVYFEGR